MKPQELASLKTYLDEIAADPSGWLSNIRRLDCSPDYEFLCEFARWAKEQECEAQKRHYVEWCQRYDMDDDSTTTRFLYDFCQQTLREVKENQDGFSSCLVQHGHNLAILKMSLDELSKIVKGLVNKTASTIDYKDN